MTSTYTAAEAARLLRVARPTIYKLARQQRLPVVSDSPLRLSRARLDAMLAADGWEPQTAPVRTQTEQRTPLPYVGAVAALRKAR